MKIIVDRKNRKYVVHDKEFHTEKGVIPEDDIKNAIRNFIRKKE